MIPESCDSRSRTSNISTDIMLSAYIPEGINEITKIVYPFGYIQQKIYGI